jgi:hypothetical protein
LRKSFHSWRIRVAVDFLNPEFTFVQMTEAFVNLLVAKSRGGRPVVTYLKIYF